MKLWKNGEYLVDAIINIKNFFFMCILILNLKKKIKYEFLESNLLYLYLDVQLFYFDQNGSATPI